VDEPVEQGAQHPNREAMWELFRGDRLAARLGIVLVDWGSGWARARWTPEPEHENFAGAIHGGALFTLGDVVFAVACNSWGRQAVALSVDAHFLAAVRPGEQLVATATERSRTRRTGSYHLDVHAEDRQVASLHAMAYRSSAWHLGEDAWPASWRAQA
jgi:acyl-CoA thioesterase